jgi:hypothetical protein
MEREVKRVPLTFRWPIGKVWAGFVNPHYRECSACHGTGQTAGSGRLSDLVGLLMLSGSDAAKGSCHPYFSEMSGLYHSHGVAPSADLAELTGALAGRPAGRFIGHDALDNWAAKKKIIQAAGLNPKKWGTCPTCRGDGIDPDVRAQHNRWRRKNPPRGKGWQLWETVSEGSPVSPVFETPEALAEWCADNTTAAGSGTYAEWLKTIVGDLPVMSMVMIEGKLMTGAEGTIAAMGETT